MARQIETEKERLARVRRRHIQALKLTWGTVKSYNFTNGTNFTQWRQIAKFYEEKNENAPWK